MGPNYKQTSSRLNEKAKRRVAGSTKKRGIAVKSGAEVGKNKEKIKYRSARDGMVTKERGGRRDAVVVAETTGRKERTRM